MRPLRIRMTAFGPFANTEEIDFTALGENPLFLINGPTGAGKTTILDGICYALYGSTTGNERDATQMRCDQAAANVLTEVELVFRLKDKTYRVRRVPQQERLKAKGEGTTNQMATAELSRIDADGTETLMVPRKVKEATDAIIDLTNLSVEQFRQVMVLPQGEFRKLLMADSKDREKVFGQLFQTQIYNRIETMLAEKSKDISKRQEANQNQQKGILQSAELAGEEALIEQQVLIKDELALREKEKNSTSELKSNASERLIKAESLHNQFKQLQLEQAQLEKLQAQQPIADSQKIELHLAKQALNLEPSYAALQEVERRHKKSTDYETQAQKSLMSAQAKTTLAIDKWQAANKLLPEMESYRAERQTLESYIPRVAQLSKARELLAEAVLKLASAQRVVESSVKITRVLQIDEKQNQDRIAELIANQIDEAAASINANSAELSLKYGKQRDTLKQHIFDKNKKIERLSTEIVAQKENLTAAQFHAKQLELYWHKGQAAILAAELADGEACLVCGSKEHPNPATAKHAIPTDEQREQAVAEVELHRKQLAGLETEKALCASDLEKSIQALQETLETLGEFSELALEQLQKNQGDAERQLQLARQQKLDIENVRQVLEQKAKDLKQQVEKHDALNLALAEVNSQHQLCVRDVDQAEQELPVAYREVGALDTAIRTAATNIQRLETEIEGARKTKENAERDLATAKANHENAIKLARETLEEFEVAKEKWRVALAKSEFPELASFLAAQRSSAQRNELEQAIDRHQQALASAKGSIRSLTESLKDCDKPDLDVLQKALDASQQAFIQAEQLFSESSQRQKILQDVAAQLEKAKKQNADIQEEYAVVGTLSAAANGKTGNRVSLHRFVLSVLLDDVLVEASQRLKRMSKGRYELYRKLDKSSGNSGSGLELMVEDAYNGKQRPVATLSGGESFMAALSMALGLSDVVQAYSGGIKLDTLFVDEGFGSLDPESLDLAVNTLIDLQAAGRMVGVISHVPELKERINVRLDVMVDREGSSTRIIV